MSEDTRIPRDPENDYSEAIIAARLKLAEQTARTNLASHLSGRQTILARLQELQDVLDLPELPSRMECFDISHSSGEATVASCVVFDQNGPRKSDYRKFAFMT